MKKPRTVDIEPKPKLQSGAIAAIVTSMFERWPYPLERALGSVTEQTRLPDLTIVGRALEGEHCGAQKNRLISYLPPDIEWLAFLDDDDYWYPHHLDALESCARETDADMVYPWFDFDRPTGRGHDIAAHEGAPFDPEELRANNYIPVTVLIRRSAVDAVGGFPDPAPPVYDDWALWLRLLDVGAKIVHLPERTWMWTTRHSTYIHQEFKDA